MPDFDDMRGSAVLFREPRGRKQESSCWIIAAELQLKTHTILQKSCSPYVSTHVQRDACQTDRRSDHHGVERPQLILRSAPTSEKRVSVLGAADNPRDAGVQPQLARRDPEEILEKGPTWRVFTSAKLEREAAPARPHRARSDKSRACLYRVPIATGPPTRRN